ncbi:MAG: 3-hydroxyacyl-ACP dehydratase FabZ family protein [Acidobacteriota bacterium]
MHFVLLDRILEIEPGHRLTASRMFLSGEPFFGDHFPGFHVVPGSLLYEALAQACGWLVFCSLGFRSWPAPWMLHQVKFRRFVRPDEEILIEARLLKVDEQYQETRGEARVRGHKVIDATICFHSVLAEPDSGCDFESLRQWAEETLRRLADPPLLAAIGFPSGRQ